MRRYVAVVKKNGSRYSVDFPDLPGCRTVSLSLDGARPKAEEILAAHISALARRGQRPPEPTPLAAISTRYAGALFFICTVAVSAADLLPGG